jgi:hypothetical protein
VEPARSDEAQSVSGPGPDAGEVLISFEGFEGTLMAVEGLVARVRQAVADGSDRAALEELIGPDLEALEQAAVRDGVNAARAASAGDF